MGSKPGKQKKEKKPKPEKKAKKGKKEKDKAPAPASSSGGADWVPTAPAGPPPPDQPTSLSSTSSSSLNVTGYDSSEYAALDSVLGSQSGVLFSSDSQKVTKADFELLKVVGKGSFGKVLQVRKKDDQQIYAMKVLEKHAIIARKQVAHTLSEKLIMQRIVHPFIVRLHYAFQTADKLFMVMDFVNGGELFFHLKNEGKFAEERVKIYAAEIALALGHLHAMDIVYRDLKPENVLIDYYGHIRITDFGLSKQIPQNGSTATFCGTPEYLAPEVLKGKGHGTPVDWWSLGTLVFEMLTGLPPFYSPNHNVMYQKILSGDIHWTSDVSPDARSLISGLLNQDPAKRFTVKQIMAHHWFNGLNWDKLMKKEIVPPWRPPISDPYFDLSQIDKNFTGLQVQEPTTSVQPGTPDQHQFDGFSYTTTSVLT